MDAVAAPPSSAGSTASGSTVSVFAAAAIALVGAPPGGTARPGDAARWDDLARLGFELAERDHVLVPDGAAAAPASIAALGLSRWEEAALLAR
ncbi:MAG TPA: hypothetical protein VMD59_10195, partial [Acidimicrobiales bacterium]|nr:hypothetical protein [Acidimicrobiales bacterium]